MRFYRTSLLLIIISMSLFSCTETDIKDIIDKSKQATFTIYTYDEYGSPSGSGSGFFISDEGIGITNYHVLEGSTKAIIRLANSEEYEIAKILASDKEWDIITFSLNTPNAKKFSYLTFANKEVEQGDKVYNISAPMGLEHTLSEGIVSSLREDSHGKIIQITAPISPGSSGSAILDDKGKVIAVATFHKQGGQNLNFGVTINSTKISELSKNDFIKQHPNYNKKDNFIILNIPDDRHNEVILHALEFKSDATIAYLSFTNLNMAYDNQIIWAELNKKEEGFIIKDNDNNEIYYIVSSTLGTSKEHGTNVALASNYRFKVFFPAIKNPLKNIDITYGTSSRGWQFRNINLDYYRNNFCYDTETYIKNYAYASMQEGDLMEAAAIFASILEKNPEDSHALNAMGLISYAIDNNSDAYQFFTKAIEAHPNNTLALYNRSCLHKYQNNYQDAIDDITKAININPNQPDNYLLRGELYLDMDNYNTALKDFSEALKSEDFSKEAVVYLYRAICYAEQGNYKNAKADIQSAYNYTTDPELEDVLQNMWKALHE